MKITDLRSISVKGKKDKHTQDIMVCSSGTDTQLILFIILKVFSFLRKQNYTFFAPLEEKYVIHLIKLYNSAWICKKFIFHNVDDHSCNLLNLYWNGKHLLYCGFCFDLISYPAFLPPSLQEQSEWSRWRWRYLVPCLLSSRRCWRTLRDWTDTGLGEEKEEGKGGGEAKKRKNQSSEAVIRVRRQNQFPPTTWALRPAPPLLPPHPPEAPHSQQHSSAPAAWHGAARTPSPLWAHKFTGSLFCS